MSGKGAFNEETFLLETLNVFRNRVVRTLLIWRSRRVLIGQASTMPLETMSGWFSILWRCSVRRCLGHRVQRVVEKWVVQVNSDRLWVPVIVMTTGPNTLAFQQRAG